MTLLLLLLSAAAVAAPPDLSGVWTLDAARSDFGPVPPPKSAVSRIAHAEPEIQVASEIDSGQERYTTRYRYTTDGRECVNTVRGNAIRSVARWQGAELLVESTGSAQGVEFKITDRWNLSEDGKSLTMQRLMNTPRGAVAQKYVYSKQ